jgi:hypothetical protein
MAPKSIAVKFRAIIIIIIKDRKMIIIAVLGVWDCIC